MVKLEIRGTADGLLEKEGIDPGRVRFANDDARMIVAGLPKGMGNGDASVSLVIALPDGTYVLAQTSLKLWILAAESMISAHGYPNMDDSGITVPPGEMMDRMIKVMDQLPPDERRIVSLRYGIEDGQPRSLRQVADAMGREPGWVRAMENKIAAKLKDLT